MPNSNHSINRRRFIGSVGATAGSVAVLGGCSAEKQANRAAAFEHGVASGDPLARQVIIWTRVTPAGSDALQIPVKWQVATDSSFATVIASGEMTTDSNRDYTVKVDVSGLSPNTKYFYRFIAGETTSTVGKTSTLPVGAVNQAKFAVVSCSNFPQGYFHVYKEISQREDLTAVLHLGDYIYEYDNQTYRDPAMAQHGRSVTPDHEIVALADYRERYSLYRRDPDLQQVHAAHPFICVWDDHEITNDAFINGAENHQPEEGDWETRKAAAVQAYREWLPIRDDQDPAQSLITYRDFNIGDLVHLVMLDTRLVGRTEPVNYLEDMIWQKIPFDVSQVPAGGAGVPLLSPEALAQVASESIKMITVPFDLTKQPPAPLLDWRALQTLDGNNLPEGFAFLPDAKAMHTDVLNDPSRHLLGQEQEAWLEQTLMKHKGHSRWQLFGQQILTGKFLLPDIRDIKVPNTGIPDDIIAALVMLGKMGMPMNTDAWDGYNVSRQRYLATIKQLAPNAVSIAGDTHNAWAFELVPDGEQEPVAVEFSTPAVSSPGMESYLATTDGDELARRVVDFNEHLHYLDTSQRGWMELTFSAEKCECQWQFVSTVKEKTYQVNAGPIMSVAHGSHRLQA